MKSLATLSALLMILAIGAGATAQSSSPVPVAIASFAPDDLNAAMPTRIGRHDLTYRALSTEESADTEPQRQAWQDLLLSAGKVPEDVQIVVAYGVPPDGSDPSVAGFVATRVEGVPAIDIVDAFIDVMTAGATADRVLTKEWVEIDGRAVRYARYVDGDPYGLYVYPKGEVLFLFAPIVLAPDDIMAALP